MGDSCTRLGPDGITFPALLKAFLGKGAEVLTAAVPGYSSHQGLAWLRLQLLAARPDVAVVYFGWNDHWRTNGLTDRQFVDSQSPWHLRLARLWPRSAGSAPLRVPAEDYRANLTAIAGEAATAGIRVLFIRAPAGIDEPARRRLTQTGYIRDDDDPMALHRAYLEILDEVARREGVFVLDAASVFAHVDTPLALLTDDGIHLTAAGHQVMAAIISQAVLRDLLHLIDDPRTPDEAAAETVHALVSGPEAGM
jgi:lysophospholipase L1-like esterase